MEDSRILCALVILKGASKNLQSIAAGEDNGRSIQQRFALNYSNSLKPLLALQIESGSSGILSIDPDLSTLRSLLSRLKDLCQSTAVESSGDLVGRMQKKICNGSDDVDGGELTLQNENCFRSRAGETAGDDSRNSLLPNIGGNCSSKSGEIATKDLRSNSSLMMQTEANNCYGFESGKSDLRDSKHSYSPRAQKTINGNRKFNYGKIADEDHGNNLLPVSQEHWDPQESLIGDEFCVESPRSKCPSDNDLRESIHNSSPINNSARAKCSSDNDPRESIHMSPINNSCISKCSGKVDTNSSTKLSPTLDKKIANSSEISKIARSIELEIDSWIDREILRHLISSLRSISISKEDALASLLQSFHDILSRKFNRKLQDLLLRSGIFPTISAVLASNSTPIRIKDLCATAICSMVKFNRDVFVGYVLVGGKGYLPVYRSLSKMGTSCSIRVLSFLVSSIKTAIVDELHSDDLLPSLVTFLSSTDITVAESGLELVLKIAYYARKEAVEVMIGANVVKRLVILQLSERGGSLIEMEERSSKPFVSCVKRFAVQIEVGEGMRRREKAEVKGVILGRVKEAVESEADAATIAAEVLWGSSP